MWGNLRFDDVYKGPSLRQVPARPVQGVRHKPPVIGTGTVGQRGVQVLVDACYPGVPHVSYSDKVGSRTRMFVSVVLSMEPSTV